MNMLVATAEAVYLKQQKINGSFVILKANVCNIEINPILTIIEVRCMWHKMLAITEVIYL